MQGAVVEKGLDLDVLAERSTQQRRRFDDQGVYIGLARPQRLLAGEGEETLRELRATVRGLCDRLGDGYDLRVAGDLLGQDFDHADDDGQDIVEIVRDPAGKLANRVHFLRLTQQAFRLLCH